MPTPAGVPVAITSPGCSVMPGGERLDDRRNIEDQEARIGALAQLGVDVAADRRVADVDLLTRDGIRTHRAERVLGFADQPLAVAALQIARGYVIDDGVAPDVVERVLRVDAVSAFADDDGELRLVVGCLGNFRVNDHRAAAGDHRFRDLGEHDGARRYRALSGAAVEAALREFVRVVVIILPDAEDIAPWRIGASITTFVMEIGESAGGRPPPSRRIKTRTPSCASASGRSNGAIERPFSVSVVRRDAHRQWKQFATFIRDLR